MLTYYMSHTKGTLIVRKKVEFAQIRFHSKQKKPLKRKKKQFGEVLLGAHTRTNDLQHLSCLLACECKNSRRWWSPRPAESRPHRGNQILQSHTQKLREGVRGADESQTGGRLHVIFVRPKEKHTNHLVHVKKDETFYCTGWTHSSGTFQAVSSITQSSIRQFHLGEKTHAAGTVAEDVQCPVSVMISEQDESKNAFFRN